jgi:hypothetical protein
MPGESRNDAAQRRRERAEWLARVGAPRHRAESGRASARALGELPASWTVLHHMVWPGRRGATIDHVVIGPGGIFVIASERWSGTLTVEDDVLREDGRPRERAVASAAEAALQVGQMSSRLSITHPVLCFAASERVTGRSREVLLCSTANVVDVLTSRPAVLNAGQVRQLASEMEQHFRSAAAAMGPAIPQPRHGRELPPEGAPPASAVRPPVARIRISGAPLRASSGREDDSREREARDRAVRIALLALVLVALVTAILLADDIGALLARLMT